MDNDGKLDIVSPNYRSTDSYFMLLNDGVGNFSQSEQTFGGYFTSVALGDINGDNNLDAFIVKKAGNQVWLNDGAGHFSDSGQLLGTGNSIKVVLGDLDNDNDLDAFVITHGYDMVW